MAWLLVLAKILPVLFLLSLGIVLKRTNVMFILPTPFIVPLFMPNKNDDNQSYVNNTLSFGTIVTIVAFIVLIFINK